MRNLINRFFPTKTAKKDGYIIDQQAITVTPVYRKRSMTEESRRSYATELLDTYYGFGHQYVQNAIYNQIDDTNVRRIMYKLTRVLPLLTYFIDSISRVYSVIPTRRFYLDNKEIVPKIAKNTVNKERFLEDEKLYNVLNNLYNDKVNLTLKQAERLTNLMNTTIYKVVTNKKGELRLVFLPNDTVQVKSDQFDSTIAEQIAFVQDNTNLDNNQIIKTTVLENWTKNYKSVPYTDNQIEYDDTVNLAAEELEKLTGSKENGYSFAPFVVFRDSGSPVDFWDIKRNDTINYIRSINISLTELKYLEKYTSFGLKYTINLKTPKDSIIDPMGMINFSVENNKIPGDDSDYKVGEFENKGRIDEVIRSIIFNLKMLYSIYSIPLDALISTNSVRSAESKQYDSKELFSVINNQRDIWQSNEQDFFEVAKAVHNRDNDYQIPKNIKMLADFNDQNDTDKTVEDWMIEIENNIKTTIDWLADENPDLDRDELFELFRNNVEINNNYESKEDNEEIEELNNSEQEDNSNEEK